MHIGPELILFSDKYKENNKKNKIDKMIDKTTECDYNQSIETVRYAIKKSKAPASIF